MEAEQVPRLRAILLADSLAPDTAEEASPTGRVLARWQPSWLRYSPLSFTGLAMILAAAGLAYQAGAGAALQIRASRSRDWRSRNASVSLPAWPSAWSWCWWPRSCCRCCDRWSLWQLVLRRDADVLHLEHGLLRLRQHTFDMRRLRGGTLREPLLVRLFGGPGWTRRSVVDGAGEASLLLPPCRRRPPRPC